MPTKQQMLRKVKEAAKRHAVEAMVRKLALAKAKAYAASQGNNVDEVAVARNAFYEGYLAGQTLWRTK